MVPAIACFRCLVAEKIEAPFPFPRWGKALKKKLFKVYFEIKILKGLDYNNPGFQPGENTRENTTVREENRIEKQPLLQTERSKRKTYHLLRGKMENDELKMGKRRRCEILVARGE